MDEYSRQVFVEYGGVAPERVTVTGLPRWDGMAQLVSQANGKDSASEVRRDLGLGIEDRLIVLATQPSWPSHTEKMIRAVMLAMAEFPDVRLVLKIHPRESLETYLRLLDNPRYAHCDVGVVADVDLHALLATSEVVVTAFSNVALEAALLDKPVLTVNLTGESDPLPFAQNGVSAGARTRDEIIEQINSLLNDPMALHALRARRHRYMEHNSQLLDGQATKRVTELVQRMRNEHA
jgi:UDP-N-acetylglucosamine 2-epimerase